MSDTCCCPPEAGSAVCELPAADEKLSSQAAKLCPQCGQAGKRVQLQTVKALLNMTLRPLPEAGYRFCRTQTCPVVYFAAAGEPVFTVDQVRERVYQKEPENGDVLVCYCFKYTAGEVREASAEGREAIIAAINAGIRAGQCACDLRNPQGNCCLGNVQAITRQQTG